MREFASCFASVALPRVREEDAAQCASRRSTPNSMPELAAALMSINAVKGVEIGSGFGAAELSGEENADI
jgi:ribulose 1,5-bisphosphate synthetase/thiazole synthase